MMQMVTCGLWITIRIRTEATVGREVNECECDADANGIPRGRGDRRRNRFGCCRGRVRRRDVEVLHVEAAVDWLW